jgi:hypothetical protein
MGMPVLVTLTSSGISRAINLDWMASKFTSYSVAGSASGTFAWTVEAALDDLQQTSSANVQWFTLSSGSANSSVSLYQGPLAGIRLNCASLSSATITLRVLEGIGW